MFLTNYKKTYSLYEDVRYRLYKGRFGGCRDLFLLLLEEVDDGGEPIHNEQYTNYIRKLTNRIPSQYREAYAKKLFTPLSPLPVETPLEALQPPTTTDDNGQSRVILNGAAVVHRNDRGEYEPSVSAGKTRTVVELRMATFPTLLERIPLDQATGDANNKSFVDDEGNVLYKRTAARHTMLSNLGDITRTEEVLYEDVMYDKISPANLYGTHVGQEIPSVIFPFVKIIYDNPAEIVNKMEKATGSEWAAWNTTFGYALPLFADLRNVDSDTINKIYLPNFRLKFTFAFLNWGMRSGVIDIKKARTILLNASVAPVEGGGTFITDTDRKVIGEVIERAWEDLEEELGKLAEATVTPKK